MNARYTVAKSSDRFTGVGLHSGKDSWIELHPTQSSGRGIIFRSHLSGVEISASAANVISTNRSTTLGNDSVKVETVEHLMSALYSSGITDVEVVFDGSELPIGDGSALPFIELIESCGVREIAGSFDDLTIEQEVVVSDGRGSIITAVPSESFWVTTVIDYSNYPAIGTLAASYAGADYKSSIAPARTYGFHHELDALRAAGLGLGANAENVVALDEYGRPDSRTPLRMEDELVRHKILDLIGDLSLTQRKIKIGIIALRPSHTVNVKLSKVLHGLGDKLGVI